jgi:hypothetical protein
MPFILGSNSVSGYTVRNSLRFNSGSSDYLNKTFATNGTDRKIRTISCWVKRAKLGTEQVIIGGDDLSANQSRLVFLSGDTLNCRLGGASASDNTTTAVFRDVSAWYHIVAVIDTTQATATNRVKIYVNGTQQTVSSPSSTQNQTTSFACSTTNGIGINGSLTGGGYYDGYISELYFIDGQALTPSSFGETATDTGIWIPKAYSGTYGTNGFYLKFANSASLGTDSSGNGNTFTVNNLTSIDQSTDTPTNNFATLNPLSQGVTATSRSYTNGNLSVTYNSGDDSSLSTIGVSTGKWYAEFKVTAIPTTAIVGVGNESSNLVNNPGSCNIGSSTGEYGYYSNGNKRNNGATATSYGSTYTTNDIIGVALDLNNGAIWFSKNGTWQNSATQAQIEAGTTTNASATGLSGTFFFGTANGASSTTGVAFDNNFGNPPYSANSYQDANGYGNFSYAVPSGFYSLCTKNLAQFG